MTFLVCSLSEHECARDMQAMVSVCKDLNVPLAPDKIFGPSQVITYLGIEIDAIAQTIRLPEDKLVSLAELLEGWSNKRKCSKQELLSLIGSLSWAARVVKPGRIFLRRLIDLSTTVSGLRHFIYVNEEARADIQWWVSFLHEWNGVELIQSVRTTSHVLALFTDATREGIGGLYGNEWFSHKLPVTFANDHINTLELLAIVAATFTWGDQWHNMQVEIFTDSLVATIVWNKGTCRDRRVMALIRALFSFAARRNINIILTHLPGLQNVAADALSRFQVAKFRRAHPSANPHPTAIHPTTWAILTTSVDGT